MNLIYQYFDDFFVLFHAFVTAWKNPVWMSEAMQKKVQ